MGGGDWGARAAIGVWSEEEGDELIHQSISCSRKGSFFSSCPFLAQLSLRTSSAVCRRPKIVRWVSTRIQGLMLCLIK